ncbi:MAG: efflux RND transporter periplasmic adaptor subunit [Gammaproteobacteria bacterium]|nr:efflux RND transporter periplasmic adaptor subunit [Gammaproteobacteria bacterium]
MNISQLGRKVLPVVVIVIAIVAAGALVATRPQPLIESVEDTGKLVEVHLVRHTTQRLAVAAKGTVIAAREVVMQPQLNGRVEFVGNTLVPGGIVREGDLLFSIERSDYRLAAEQARTRVAEAEAALALERGRRAVAEREWALFEDELSSERDDALARRQPQLKSAEASLAAVRSQLEQARLNLQRTQVRAPFNAVVITESVEVGQIVSPQTQVAQLAGTDRFWVQVSVAVADLSLIDVATDNETGTTAEIRYDTGNGTIVRAGEVVRRLAGLERAGQMARLIVAVDDPLDLQGKTGDRLLLDSFVDVVLNTSREVEVVSLHPKWLRNGNEVYLYDRGKLAISSVNVVMRRPDAVLVDAGLNDGDAVVTTTLSAPVVGTKLRLSGDPSVAISTP